MFPGELIPLTVPEQRHHLVPRRPVRRPVREKPHQILMQPDGPSLMRLRLPDQQRRRLSRIVEIPPLEFHDLGDPQTGTPHDERSGAGLVPVMSRQRIQKTAHLVGSPVMGNIHHGRVLYELCQKEATSAVQSRTTTGARRPKVAEFTPKSAIRYRPTKTRARLRGVE